MKLIDILDTDDTVYAPIRAARLVWIEATKRSEETGDGAEEVVAALKHWQDVTEEMRPSAGAWVGER